MRNQPLDPNNNHKIIPKELAVWRLIGYLYPNYPNFCCTSSVESDDIEECRKQTAAQQTPASPDFFAFFLSWV